MENIAGNIEKQTETKQADEHSTQTEAEQLQTNGTQAAEASAPDETAGIQAGTELSGMTDTDEAQTYLKQGYYVVRQGDNLAAICRKIYQTTAMMDKVCEANGIDDPDAIYAGQYLTLPN